MLNAIPDVNVTDDADAAMFTISVDVNAITNKSDDVLGYSLASTIYGNYDQRFLSALFDELAKSANSADAAIFQVLQYAVSGNVFLAGFVHTHGPTDEIDSAFDQIVSDLKYNALPEARKMLLIFDALLGGQPDAEHPASAPKALRSAL